jgi:Leucine-rich repeat (LRR) protein
MYCRKVSGVSVPIGLSRRHESARSAEETRQSDPEYMEALHWINARRRGNERRETAVNRLLDAKPGDDVPLDNLALTSVPEPLVTRASTAKSLSLSGNALPAIPHAILNFGELQGLSISGNELTALSPHISQMHNLRSLDVSHNAIADVPETIGTLSKLESLNLGDNALRSLPNTIGNLSKLKQLKLSGNMLNHLPPQIAQCSALRELDISRNHFEMIPPEVGSLSKLRKLKADRNQLTDLEPNADDPDGLHDRAIPEAIGRLPHLEELDVAGNPLAVLPNSFGPFEYASKRKLEIVRQGTNTLFSKVNVFSKNLRIRIANTPLPKTLVTDGRLPELPGSARLAEPVYEPLYDKVPHAFDAQEPPSPDAHPQRPIAQTARAIPELFAAQTALGQAGAAAFDAFARHTAGHDGAPYAPQPQLQPPQSHPAYHPAPPLANRGPATHEQAGGFAQPNAAAQAPANDAPPFAFPAAQQHNAATPSTSMRGPLVPPGQAPEQASPEQAYAQAASNMQAVPPAAAQAFARPPMSVPLPSSGMPPIAFSPAAQLAAHSQGGVPFAPAHVSQTVPGVASAHPFQPMPAGPSFPPASGFAQTALDPRAAAYAQAVQIASSLLQRPPMPQAHAAPIRTAGANDSWFDYSRPTLDPVHQFELDRLGFEQVQQNTLEGLSLLYRERLYLQGEHLIQRVEQAKLRASMGIPGESLGINVWRVGIMMFRQHVICNLAETVADINRQKKLTDPSQSYLVDDPLQIALVYQTIVSEELQILGLEPLRERMDTPQFKAMFRRIVSPERTELVRQGILREVAQAEAENDHATLTAFINEQAFWQDYLASQRAAATAAWRGAYGF